jgi:transcriptional regulator with XRE-family HTH domain
MGNKLVFGKKGNIIMSFGTNLERVRKEHKLSQASLGTALGITQQMISSYEKDISSPNIESLIKLSNYFQISIDALVDHTIEPEDSDSQRSQFTRLFESFSVEDKDRCLLILNTLLLDREESNKSREKKAAGL